ncbi:hypothetical protein [Sulfuricystis multivorans]|uniref:hypothetical protein n=1 Tax=Sulfuricystis multivorans TaxID=2211108 RepID=UPI000F82A9DA|nr:hypothetical protein [Sulfuricystis multivorans]
MPTFRWLPAALALTVSAVQAAEETPRDGESEYLARAAEQRCIAGETVLLAVPLPNDMKIDYDATSSRLRVFYPMQFNDLTEGWNWHPEEVAAGRDYYTFKYLPLGSTTESRSSDRLTALDGKTIEYPVEWHFDYFLAFDNPYEFYPRDAGEQTGFAAEIVLPAAAAQRLAGGDLRMAVRARLNENCLSDSTTFWKATISKPVDFTLKKRYLVGRLEEVRFTDAATGRLLARLPAGIR